MLKLCLLYLQCFIIVAVSYSQESHPQKISTGAENIVKIIIKDTTGIARQNWPVAIRLCDLTENISSINWEIVFLKDNHGNIIPHQIDQLHHLNDKYFDDELVFLIDLKPFEKQELVLCSDSSRNNKNSDVKTDLSFKKTNERGIVENEIFSWELRDAEEADFRLKTDKNLCESWQVRTWTWAGTGHEAPLHDFHYRHRRLLNEVRDFEILSSGSVRIIARVFYDFIHYEENLDVERILIIYSHSPVVEKISTSLSGEPGIVLATMQAKMGSRTVADGFLCGGYSFPVTYPRIFPKQPEKIPVLIDPDMNFECISTQFNPTYQHTASYRVLNDIDGLTWGAIWNPESGQGKAEIARIDDVSGYITGWEQDRVGARRHPRTNRSFGDFLFACTNNRTFRHYTVFFNQKDNKDHQLTWLDNFTKSLANPVSVEIENKPTGKPTINKPEKLQKEDLSEPSPETLEKITALTYVDYCSLLARPDKRTLHGNFLRYWAGQPDIYWQEKEPETLGFTHAWYFDGKQWGSFAGRDWEFWRKERIAYGRFHDFKTDTTICHPRPEIIRWEPGRLDIKYDLEGIEVLEEKILYDDVLADRILLNNTRDEEARFKLVFSGHGHAMSEAYYDEERDVIIIEEHAYAYTGLNKIFFSTIPFTSWHFKSGTLEDTGMRTESNIKNDRQYGEPVNYTFEYEFLLKPGEKKEFTLAFTMDRDVNVGCDKLKMLASQPWQMQQMLREHWNHWLNYEIPRFRSNDDQLNKFYYYNWFVYRCNLIDANQGWYKYPFVAPTASTYFMTMFGWDSAFHAMIGKWLANPERYAYGNLLNWTLVQSDCGFLPEFFGQDWRTTWGHRLSLLGEALFQVYQKTGDLELVKQMYPTLKKSEQWQSCEIDYSPYWEKYYRNIWNHENRIMDYNKGKLWFDGSYNYYRHMATMADLVGDDDYADILKRKTKLCKNDLTEDSPAYKKEPIKEVNHPHHFGHPFYWAHSLVNRERAAEVASGLFDTDKRASVLHVAALPLEEDVGGDGWDHGASVTTNFFLNEGLFRVDQVQQGLGLLLAQIDASFIETSNGPQPTAPEYWDVKGQPWGCIEYAWNGLLNMLLIERVCGIVPDIPNDRIVVQPNLPSRLNYVEMRIPFGTQWTTFKVEVIREETWIQTITVKSARYDLILKPRTPEGMKVTAVLLNGNDVSYRTSGNLIEVDISKNFDATLAVHYTTIH